MAAPKGHDGQGGGRPKGSPNKATAEFKQAVTNLLEYAMPEMVNWLKQIAEKDPEKALELIHKYAQFAHPLLARTEVKHEGEIDMKVIDDASARAARIVESIAARKSGSIDKAP